jgi:hypothetical protein
MRRTLLAIGVLLIGGCVADEPGRDCSPGCDGGTCEPGEWATICAGTFLMGAPPDEVGRHPNEMLHEVTLTHSFSIETTEVTQDEFEALMGINPSRFTGCGGDCPAEMLSWHQAAAYCNALSDVEGLDRCYRCAENNDSMEWVCPTCPTKGSPRWHGTA